MGPEWTIPLEELTVEAFAPFGRIVQIPSTPATSSGPGWQCWYGFQALDCPWPLYLGVVATEYRPIVITEMERRLHTFEPLYRTVIRSSNRWLRRPRWRLRLPAPTRPRPERSAFLSARPSSCTLGHGTVAPSRKRAAPRIPLPVSSRTPPTMTHGFRSEMAMPSV